MKRLFPKDYQFDEVREEREKESTLIFHISQDLKRNLPKFVFPIEVPK